VEGSGQIHVGATTGLKTKASVLKYRKEIMRLR